MKRAAAKPQSILSADIYLSDNTGGAPALAFAQDVRISGWTTVGDRAGRKNGSGAYVVYDCVILTKEVSFSCFTDTTCVELTVFRRAYREQQCIF